MTGHLRLSQPLPGQWDRTQQIICQAWGLLGPDPTETGPQETSRLSPSPTQPTVTGLGWLPVSLLQDSVTALLLFHPQDRAGDPRFLHAAICRVRLPQFLWMLPVLRSLSQGAVRRPQLWERECDMPDSPPGPRHPLLPHSAPCRALLLTSFKVKPRGPLVSLGESRVLLSRKQVTETLGPPSNRIVCPCLTGCPRTGMSSVCNHDKGTGGLGSLGMCHTRDRCFRTWKQTVTR